jgi:hypothetical protein
MRFNNSSSSTVRAYDLELFGKKLSIVFQPLIGRDIDFKFECGADLSSPFIFARVVRKNRQYGILIT